MAFPKIQQRTERWISAALRLVLVAVLLLLQIAVVFLLSYFLQRRAALAYTLLELLAVICAVTVYNRPGGSNYNFGWILLILVVPVAGMILYLLWGGPMMSKRLALKEKDHPAESVGQHAVAQGNVEALRDTHPEWGRLAAYLDRQGFLLYGHTGAQYLPTGEAYLEDMLRHMEQAEHFIFMEFYIVARGELWNRMMEIFRRKCAEGVEVKLLFDDFGSMMRFDREEVSALRRLGAEVEVFNPVHQYVNRLYFNYRNHRKIACIDGHIAYTGGANLADEYANIIRRFGYWKDCGVRLEGEGAWGLTREFLCMWQRVGGSIDHEIDRYRPQQAVEGVGFCQAVADGPDNNPVAIAEDVYLQIFSGAKRSLTITTPYLAIDEAMLKTLSIAGDAGVEVRLLLPGVPDHKVAYLVAQSYFKQLLEHHVQIYLYTPGLLHGKTVLADDEVAFIGSVNMDYRSFQLHFECGVVLYDMPTLADLRQDMENMIAQSHLLTAGEWNRRSWIRKIAGKALRLFAMWM